MITLRGTLKSASRSAGEIADVALGHLFALAQHDGCGDFLAQLGVGQGEGHDLRDRGVRRQDAIHLKRADLFAAAVDDLLQPAGERQIAVLVERALIAGAEPALALGLEEILGVGLGVALVARVSRWGRR
jgi:hypothetical protein